MKKVIFGVGVIAIGVYSFNCIANADEIKRSFKRKAKKAVDYIVDRAVDRLVDKVKTCTNIHGNYDMKTGCCAFEVEFK